MRTGGWGIWKGGVAMRRVLRGDGGRKLGEGTFGRDRVMGDRRGGDNSWMTTGGASAASP